METFYVIKVSIEKYTVILLNGSLRKLSINLHPNFKHEYQVQAA